MKKLQFFDQNPGLSPLKKCQFWRFLKPMFLMFRKACLLYKTSKIIFFNDLFSRSMTWEYKVLQGVTGGYKGLQGVTRRYKGLQGVTRRYQGWQGMTRRYRGLHRIIKTFFELERSQILFLGLFCLKIKFEEISNFWPKRCTNPFKKVLILRFSYTVVFIVFKRFFFSRTSANTFSRSIFHKH